MGKQNFEEPRNLKEGVLKNLETEQSLNELVSVNFFCPTTFEVDTAFIFPPSKIPKLFLNRSVEIQLQTHLDKYGGKAISQSIKGDEPTSQR